MKPSFKYMLYLTTGSISLSLGVVGLFLPILPTTPFLLLSSYCFLRSSKKMHLWLTQHKIFGTYLSNYMEHKAIKKSHRNSVLFFLWFTLLISMFLSANLHLTLFLSLVGIGVTIHLFMLRSME
jgi:hypothetical protein